MEFVQLVHELTPEGEETKVSLLTRSDSERCVEQDDSIRRIQESCAGRSVAVEYDYDKSDTLHARSISTDTGWKSRSTGVWTSTNDTKSAPLPWPPVSKTSA